jgi:hypothetical protein
MSTDCNKVNIDDIVSSASKLILQMSDKICGITKMFKTYQPPFYPVSKQELFNEDHCKAILLDESFARADRNRLTQYNKHRTSGGTLSVTYNFATGCAEHRLGRIFPADGIGLAGFRFDIRNPLAEKFYWDIDIENAHYNIAVWYAEQNGLYVPNLKKYCENRDSCLAMVSDNRKLAKTEFLKILYGGDIKLYNEHYEFVEGIVKDAGFAFLRELEKETKQLMDLLWVRNEHLTTVKMGKEKKTVKTKNNPKASLMALLFQTKERELLEMVDYALTQKGRRFDVPIHDGGFVCKLDGETEFPKDIMAEFSEAISLYSGVHVILTQKQIKFDWKPPLKAMSQYQQKKLKFEEKYHQIGPNFICVDQYTQEISTISFRDMKIISADMNWVEYDAVKDKDVKKIFLDEYNQDESRCKKDRVDFIPDLENCPPNVFNLFRGFEAEKCRPKEPYTVLRQTEIDSGLQIILKHHEILTGGFGYYLSNVLAWILQNPSQKCQVALLFRDEDGIVSLGGGTGKNLFFDELIGKRLIGEDYYLSVADNAEIYATFNGMLKSKLIVNVEEADGKDNHSNVNQLKSAITKKKMSVNEKGINQYNMQDLATYFMSTNTRNAVPAGLANRRFAPFDVDKSFRGNEQYFKNLIGAINDPDVVWAYYQYLKGFKTYANPFEFQKNIPNTSALRDMTCLNCPNWLRWIKWELENKILTDDSMGALYSRYKKYVSEWKEGKEVGVLSLTSFGLKLKNDEFVNANFCSIGDKHITRYNTQFHWNIPNLVGGFKKLGLLDSGFVYSVDKESGGGEEVCFNSKGY